MDGARTLDERSGGQSVIGVERTGGLLHLPLHGHEMPDEAKAIWERTGDAFPLQAHSLPGAMADLMGWIAPVALGEGAVP